MKTKVFRNKVGDVVNIGDWDYRIEEIFEDEKKVDEIIHNPLPDDLIESEEKVTVLEDGSKVVSTEYRKLRKLSYPSIEDQLDHIYHNGIESWKTEMIEPVKERFKKPIERS